MSYSIVHMMNTSIFLILTFIARETASAKILGVFMTEMHSHFNFNNAIVEILARSGHEVTVISPFKPKEPLANITYIQARKETPTHVSPWSKVDLRNVPYYQLHETSRVIFNDACELFMSLQETKDILAARTTTFDLMFVGVVPLCECYFPVAHRLHIPLIGTSSFDPRYKSMIFVDDPFHPAVSPHFYSKHTSKMTFIQRLRNTVEIMYLDFLHFMLLKPQLEKFYQKHYSKEDPWSKQMSLHFVNSHRSMLPGPHVSSMIQIAGVHLKRPQPLSANLEEFILGAEHGVILFSLGTVASSKELTTETRQIFRNVFATIPQRVIWKFSEQIDGISNNVIITDWISQQDVLAHKNVILFISHAGKSSTIEAVHTETPVLAVPLFQDQFVNAANMKELGVAIVLDLSTMTEDSLRTGIREILHNQSYQDRMKKVSQAFKDRPMSPKETVLYWTEYVLRHNGAKHLQTAAANKPFYHYLLMDVVCFIIFGTIVILLLVKYVIKKIYESICSANRK